MILTNQKLCKNGFSNKARSCALTPERQHLALFNKACMPRKRTSSASTTKRNQPLLAAPSLSHTSWHTFLKPRAHLPATACARGERRTAWILFLYSALQRTGFPLCRSVRSLFESSRPRLAVAQLLSFYRFLSQPQHTLTSYRLFLSKPRPIGRRQEKERECRTCFD